jgi:hypothetical protein
VASEKEYTVNNFYGDVNHSQIQQNSTKSSQSMHIQSVDTEKLGKLALPN